MLSTKLILIFVLALVVFTTEIQCRGKKKNPCGNGQTPLSGVFCGRGPTRRDCPANYQCVIAPNDAYAVCCPIRYNKRTKTTTDTKPNEKFGSCPPPPTGPGICIAQCVDDSNCRGNEKCCGGCPRKCVSPVY